MLMSYCDYLLAHYEARWNSKAEVADFRQGPIWELPEQFRVVRFPPHDTRECWTYATVCMSTPEDSSPLELHLLSYVPSNDLTEILYATAHYHRTGAALGLDHTVNFGRPWLTGSSCEHGLISLPYLDGPALEWASIGSVRTRFLWLVPISRSELNFSKANGISALEDLFEKCAVDYANPFRKAVI